MVKRTIVRKRYSLRLCALRNSIPPSLLQFEDMNDDCLEHMFNFLDINSLMKVCRVGKRVKNIVVNHVIPLKTIKFSDVSSVWRAFALFGKSMTRIIVHCDDIPSTAVHSKFSEFLRLLVKYGVPGRFLQVNLSFGGNEDGIPIEVLSVIGPYFENVHTLNFNLMSDYMRFFHQFMNAIPKYNLHTLSLHRVQVIGDWLVAEALPRLTNIHLCIRWSPFTALPADRTKIEELNETRLINFISNKTASLVYFDFDCLKFCRIFVEMSQRIPNIEHLGRLMWWPSIIERENDNGNANLAQMYREKWEFLNAYKNLKSISLASDVYDCSDLGEVFRILAVQNTIEELTL